MLSQIRRRLTVANGIAFLALFFAVGGQFVFAHGGDATKIHACVVDNGGQVTIVGDPTGYGSPVATCQAGTHALDWSANAVAGPTGDAGPTGGPGPKGDPGPPGDPSKVIPPGAVAERLPPPEKLAELTGNKVVLRKATLGPSTDSSKGATVACPSSHPFIFEGGASAAARVGFVAFRGPITYDADYPVIWLANHALTHGWTADALTDVATVDANPTWDYYGGSKSIEWTLTVWVKCASTRNKAAVHFKFKR
jgi:hypothetical protein